jgi:putative SOS response-associated peptidase YedK
VLPASGFYEWQSTEGERQKQAYHIGLRG